MHQQAVVGTKFGNWEDFRGSYDTLFEAMAAKLAGQYDNYQIEDLEAQKGLNEKGEVP